MDHQHNRPVNNRPTGDWKRRMLFAALVAAAGCGGSNSQTPDGTGGTMGGTGGSSGTGTGGSNGGTGGTSGGTGGAAPGTGGSNGGTGGAGPGSGGVVGTDGGGGDMGGGNNCAPQTTFTLAVHVIMDATWAGSTATNAGSGKIHLWNRAKLNANGLMLAGDTNSCGTVLPPFDLNGAGMLVTGGSKVSIEVPHSVWDTPTIPKFPNSGNITGWNAGSTIKIVPTVALVGLTMADPMAAWPKSYTGIMAVDADGDGPVGFTAIPKQGNGFVAPPTGLGLFGSAPAADKVYLASRTVVALDGKLTSCTEQEGTATISFFDSHVVGCHIKGGGECTANQTDFVDQSRTDYKVTSGTFKSKQVADGASCADVRAALPM